MTALTITHCIKTTVLQKLPNYTNFNKENLCIYNMWKLLNKKFLRYIFYYFVKLLAITQEVQQIKMSS